MWAQGSQWNQMPLDAAAYQNISHELVDWAALAQQWIQMREAHETSVVNVPAMIQSHVGFSAVQPRNIHHLAGLQVQDSQVNGGEVPMDVEREDEHSPAITSDIKWSPQVMRPQLPNSWIPPQPLRMGMPQQIGAPLPAMPPVFPQVSKPLTTMPHLFVTSKVTQSSPGIGLPMLGNSQTSTPTVNIAPSLPRLPLLPQSSRQGSSDEDSNGAPSCTSAPIDAAKRKNLPAWIREGLEKMEREKLKKEERERFLRERELNRRKQLMEETPYETDPAASRFDDSDDSNQDAKDSDSDGDESPCTRSPPPSSQALPTKDLMLVIRQLMTEVLLEVTTEEIRSAAIEAHQQAKVKSRQVQHSLPSKSLTQKLGLDQYGSDSDEDDVGGSQEQPTGNQREVAISDGNSEGEARKTEQTSSNGGAVDSTTCFTSNTRTKVETDSLKVNGLIEAGQSDLQEKEMRVRGLNVEGNHSGSSDKRLHDTSSSKEEKRLSRRSSSRDRRRSRSRDRHSRRSRNDRSRSRRRSRSRGRRSSRSDRRDSSRDRKRSRRSSSKGRRRNSRADSRERSRSSSRSRTRDYRRSRS